MASATRTHEELATKEDLDARFDIIVERLDRLEEKLTESDYRHSQHYAQISYSLVSILSVMTLNALINLNERVGKLVEKQQVIIETLERIERQINTEIGS